VVTDRDRSVVRWVAVIGAASAVDVIARFRLERTVGYRRLAALVHHGLLSRERLVYGQPALYVATRDGLASAGYRSSSAGGAVRAQGDGSAGRASAGPASRALAAAPAGTCSRRSRAHRARQAGGSAAPAPSARARPLSPPAAGDQRARWTGPPHRPTARPTRGGAGGPVGPPAARRYDGAPQREPSRLS